MIEFWVWERGEWSYYPTLDKYKDNKNRLIYLMLLDLFLIKYHILFTWDLSTYTAPTTLIENQQLRINN